MKFGVREICDVVLRAKSARKIGNKIFYKNEPVIYFDTLKTSSMEGAATTVYAQGGRGNARLVSWDGERTVTFTMEDALISPEGFSILSGAGLISAGDAAGGSIKQHLMETISKEDLTVNTAEKTITIELEHKPYTGDASTTFKCSEDHYIYVMFRNGDEIISEPYIDIAIDANNNKKIILKLDTETNKNDYLDDTGEVAEKKVLEVFDSILVDYYTERTAGAQQIEITPDKFGGSFYLEASTLFRTQDGVDMPAEFIIPNCRIQSNFTFSMASSGDPSTFTFTMDAFPDYTRFDKSKKVLACIQMITEGATGDAHRDQTYTEDEVDTDGIVWETDCPEPA